MPENRVILTVVAGEDTVSLRHAIDAIAQRSNLRIREIRLAHASSASGFWGSLRQHVERWLTTSVISASDVDNLLRKAFPKQALTLQETATHAGALYSTGSRTPFATAGGIAVLIATSAATEAAALSHFPTTLFFRCGKAGDLALSDAPIWSLRDHAASVELRVYRSERGNTDAALSREVRVHPNDTPESLHSRLEAAAFEMLNEVLEAWPPRSAAVSLAVRRSAPTERERLELVSRLPAYPVISDRKAVLKGLYFLALYFFGVYHLTRLRHSFMKTRAAILLHHRVNDLSRDQLTASTRRFAEHLVVLKKFYRPIASLELVGLLEQRQPIAPTAVAIHFDDCYRDVCTNAQALLAAAGFPGTFFVSSGFIGTTRAFNHDREKSAHTFENASADQILSWLAASNEVAAHTVNHVNLGSVELETARREVRQSREDLEQLTQSPVTLFSFPFGRPQDFREEVRQEAREAGYSAVFSAHGGFIDEHTNVWDIPRLGVSESHPPLYLIMELEGLRKVKRQANN